MKTDIAETAIHTSYLPWLTKVDALIGENRRAGTLGPRQTHEFHCSMAEGPQPARGGRRCQEPLELPTLATLADALESNLGRERVPPLAAARPAAG